MFATLPDYAKALDDRKQNTASGLASILRLAGTGVQLPLWDRVGHIAAPTLTMAGELDTKFLPELKAAAEMARVCRRGGKIGLANWTPEGFIGQLFKTIGRYVPPPAGLMSPALWGTRERIAELFGTEAALIASEKRHFVFRYRSPEHWLAVFRGFYGPVLKAFEATDAGRRVELEREMLGLVERFNRAHDGTMVVPGEYLQVVVTRQ